MLFDHDPFEALRTLNRLTGFGNQVGGEMPMDVHRDQDRFIVELDVPGVDPGSIDVSVGGRTLTVSAERNSPKDGHDRLIAERPRGQLSRRLNLGPQLGPEDLHASYDDGVLTLTITVAEEAGPRQITVEHGDRASAVTSGSTS
jgi:HSP20 family protein